MTEPLGIDEVLRVDGVSKKFSRSLRHSLAYGVRDAVQEIFGLQRRSDILRQTEFWALKDISFSLRAGGAIGLIGRNGSGKTTLLRLISGLIKPDAGEIHYRGRLAPLIALGAGFTPILTGRENVKANLSILGLTRGEINERFDEVVAFAELGDAIDAPIQTYSSGMAARLGFACAIHTDPDLLLIDEVLSVGDARFRSKCYRKLADLRSAGVAFLLVSHNANAILSMTDKAIYLMGGRKVMEDNPDEVLSRYEEDVVAVGSTAIRNRWVRRGETEEDASQVLIEELYFTNESGAKVESIQSGHGTNLHVRYSARSSVDEVALGIIIRELSDESEVVLNLSSDRDGMRFRLSQGAGELQLVLPYCGLRPGLYSAKVYMTGANLETYDIVETFRFRVVARGMSQSMYYQPRAWRVAKLQAHADIERS